MSLALKRSLTAGRQLGVVVVPLGSYMLLPICQRRLCHGSGGL